MKQAASATLIPLGEPSTPASRPERRELICSRCAYGIVVAGRVPACPMSGRGSWEPRARLVARR